jgi:hypothetical protein
MKVITTIILFLLWLYFSSCKYECPGFNDSDLCWIPYNVGDQLSYIHNEDTIKFQVVDFYKTMPSSFTGLAMDYACDYEGYYETNRVSLDYYIKEHFSYIIANFGTWGDGMKIQITANDIFIFNVLWYNEYKIDSLSVSYNPNMVIANHEYHDVYTLSKIKMTEPQRISWVIKAKDKGIVQFYDRKSDKLWTLLEQ